MLRLCPPKTGDEIMKPRLNPYQLAPELMKRT